MVSVCSGAYRMSKRGIEELVEDFFDVPIALGSIANLEQATSEAVAAPVAEVARVIREQPVVHADETGWFERSKRAWLWVAVSAHMALFLSKRSRLGSPMRAQRERASARQQGRRGVPVESGFAGGGHVIEDIPALHPQRGYHGENPLHEATSARTVGAEAGLAPHHAVPDPVLADIVRRFDPLDGGEGPRVRLLFVRPLRRHGHFPMPRHRPAANTARR